MSEQLQIIEQPLARHWSLFFYLSSASMFVVIAIASCTSTQAFSDIYSLIADFLSLDTITSSLRSSPGWGHFICYTLLSFSLSGVYSRHNLFIGPVMAVIFGVLMEFVQSFIPSRDASLMDIGINFLGVVLGFGVYRLWVTYVRRAVRPRFN
jgi:VanZ family protein